IATTEVGAELVLLPAIPDFLASHPALTLEIDASPRLADLSRDDEWIALRFADPVKGDHVVRRLGEITFGLFAAPTAPRDRGIGWTATFAELSLARFVDQRFPHQVIRLGSVRAHRGAAELGLGVAALPTFAAGASLERVGTDELTLPVWLVIPRGIRRLGRVVAAASWVESAFAAVRRGPVPGA
ncbi:MAG: LysR substrate-binding domain-containing protein, partial [Myxococcota bacterium]